MKKLNFFRKLGEKTKSSDQNESQTPPNQAENPYSQRISANQDAYEQNTKLQMASGPDSFQSSQHAPIWGAAQTTSTLPAYSPPQGSAPYSPPQGSVPSYRNSPNLSTGSPNPSETSPSFSNSPKPPAYSSGYGNQALGARNNIGRYQRFEDSNQQQSPPMPRQSPGQNSWGGFDDPNKQDLLPSTYGQPKPTPGPTYSQGGPSDGMPGFDGGQQREMTEDEQVAATKEQVKYYTSETLGAVHRVRQKFIQANQMADVNNQTLDEQQDRMNHAYQNLIQSGSSATRAERLVDEVPKSYQMTGGWGQDQRDAHTNSVVASSQKAGADRYNTEMQRQAGVSQSINGLPQQPRTLGGTRKRNPHEFELDDDDGTQRRMNEEIDDIVENELVPMAAQLGRAVNQQKVKLESQNILTGKMLEEADNTRNRVEKGQRKMNIQLQKK